jgi:hypothetical protein
VCQHEGRKHDECRDKRFNGHSSRSRRGGYSAQRIQLSAYGISDYCAHQNIYHPCDGALFVFLLQKEGFVQSKSSFLMQQRMAGVTYICIGIYDHLISISITTKIF